MAYLGRVELKSSDIQLKASTTISGSSTNTVVLTWTAPTEQSIILKVNGVVQHTDAYSIAGSPTTITLASGNFADGATVEVVGINDIGTTIVPADGSVTRPKLATTGTPTGAKFLQDDMAWTTVDSLPSQTSQSGKYLTTNGTTASWGTVATSTPGLVKLASTEVTTGVAAVIFDSSVVTAYDNYLIIVNGVKTASSAANGTISFSTDNGSTFIAKQKFSAHVINMNTGADGGIHTTSFTLDSVSVPTYFDNNSVQPVNGYFYFFNCNPETDSTFSVHCNYSASYTNQSGTEYNLFGACMYDVTAGQQANYFKLVNATENISEGRVTLYGMDQ